MSLYKKITKADQVNKEGGYKNVVYMAPRDRFLAIAKPTLNLTSLGGGLTITTSHTFPADAGFYSFLSKKHAVTTKATSTGEDGSKSLSHSFEFVLLGDSSTTLDQMRSLLNEEAIFLVKDQDCLNATDYIQLGDECLSPDITVEFDGKTTKEGLKEYKVSGVVKDKKFFYQGTITEAVDTTGIPNAIVSTSVSNITSTSMTIFWTVSTPPAIVSYEVQRSLSPAMTSPTTSTPTPATLAVTGLTAATNYYFRVRAVNAAGNGPWSAVFGGQTA